MRGWFVLGVIAAACVTRADAQSSSVRSMMVEDSLSAAKVELRDYVARLSDSLTAIKSIQPRMARARASHMDGVVTSLGRDLGRKCMSSGGLTRWTANAVGYMRTNNPHGDQALAVYIASLNELSADLVACHHDDSAAMAARPVEPTRISQVADSVTSAIDRYNGMRDALLRLLGIDLPAKGTMPVAH
jgi:hypothetical protein